MPLTVCVKVLSLPAVLAQKAPNTDAQGAAPEVVLCVLSLLALLVQKYHILTRKALHLGGAVRVRARYARALACAQRRRGVLRAGAGCYGRYCAPLLSQLPGEPGKARLPRRYAGNP